MDSHYTFPSFSAPPGQAGHQAQQMNGLPNLGAQHSSASQTLPSLSGAGLPISTSYGHASTQSITSLPSHTPSSSVSSVSGFGYHQNSQAAHARGLQLPMPQPPLRPVEPSSTATTSAAYSTAIASSYVTSAPMSNSVYSNNLINIQPRPQELFGHAQAYPSLSHLPTQSSSLYLPPMDTQQPTHVVGQQGRRGVLPSVSGKEAPVTAKGVIPQKAADGKFHCEYCTRTYQHAKHLKRHHLRHTGERPYMCNLCSDTFSRSDILKRHYQKCAQRRGVPEGTDHLEGSRAHLSRRQRSRPGSRGNSSGMPDVAGYGFSDLAPGASGQYLNGSSLSNIYGTQHHHTESASSTSTEPMLRNDSHHPIHDGSTYRPRSMPPMEAMTLGSNTFDSPQSYSVPSTTAADMNNGMSAYAVQHSTSTDQLPNGLGYNGHAMDGAGNGYSYSMTSNMQVGMATTPIVDGRYQRLEQAISIQ